MNIRLFNREVASFHAAALILGSAAFVSKLLGLLRDRLLASHFGAGATLDVYYAAFQIPDLIYTLFLVGAAAAAVLPVFLEYERKGNRAAEDFISNLLSVFSIGAVVLIAVAMAGAPWLVRLAAPGFGGAERAAVIGLTRLMMANTLFLGISGIFSAVLQARRRFFVFALPPIAYNLGIIIGIIAIVPVAGTTGLAWGVVLGGFLQVLVQLPALAAMRFRYRPAVSIAEPGLRRVLFTALPRVTALSMSQVTLVVLAAIASFFAAGSLAAFRLATNLIYVPVGLFGVSYALAVFPKLSGASLGRDAGEFWVHLSAGVRNVLIWVLPAMVLAVVLRAHVVRVVFGAGAFDWEDTRIVAAVLAVLALAIVSESLLPLVLRAFYALGETAAPLAWDIAGSVATVAFALGLSAVFARHPALLGFVAEILRIGDLPSPRIIGVALGFSLGSILNVALLWAALIRASRRHFGKSWSLDLSAIVQPVAAALAAGIAAYAALIPFPALLPTNTFVGILTQGLSAGLVGIAVYALCLWWLRNPEMLGFIETARRKMLTLGRAPQLFEAEKVDGDSAR